MNKDNAKDYLPLVQALAEGRTIQVKTVCGWVDSESIGFVFPPDQYRIKPEPREIWVNEYPCGEESIHENSVNAANALRDDGITRHYREVIE